MNALQPKGPNNEPLHGVTGSEGLVWTEMRKFMLKNLSDLGMGKNDTMEDIIQQEACQIVKRFKDLNGTHVKSKVQFFQRNDQAKMI